LASGRLAKLPLARPLSARPPLLQPSISSEDRLMPSGLLARGQSFRRDS
jgi:hypothetical protein